MCTFQRIHCVTLVLCFSERIEAQCASTNVVKLVQEVVNSVNHLRKDRSNQYWNKKGVNMQPSKLIVILRVHQRTHSFLYMENDLDF